MKYHYFKLSYFFSWKTVYFWHLYLAIILHYSVYTFSPVNQIGTDRRFDSWVLIYPFVYIPIIYCAFEIIFNPKWMCVDTNHKHTEQDFPKIHVNKLFSFLHVPYKQEAKHTLTNSHTKEEMALLHTTANVMPSILQKHGTGASASISAYVGIFWLSSVKRLL